MSGLFGTFNISTRGLFAQQKAIDTTSHNIANANTEGYSRQRVTFETSRPFPMPSLNNAVGPGQLGTGVDVASINRIRDSFLDYQVRVEMGINGQFTGRDKFLSEIENIMNEPTDTGISSLIGKFFDSWNTLATSASKSNAKSIVAQQSLALANELNHSYTELESLKKNTQTVIKDTVFDVNSIITQLNQVNQQIAQVKVAGNNPNDLMDRRDLLLDQLSSKFGIKIDKKTFDAYDVTTSNEAKYADAGDNGAAPTGPKGILNLVQAINPEETCRFSYIDSIVKDGSSEEKFDGAGTYTVTYYKNGDKTTDANKVTIKVNIADTGAKGDPNYVSAEDKFKQLSECRVLWANNSGVALKTDGKGNVASTKDADNLDKSDTPLEVDFENLALFKAPSGELKGYMSVQKDVDTYEGQLNKFAKALALSVNAIMSQGLDPSKDSATDINNFFVNADAAKKGVYTGDVAGITAAEKEITAANITVNDAIIKNPMLIKSAAQYDASGNPIGESDGTRALAVEMLRDSLMKIQDINSDTTRADFLKDSFKTDPKLNISVITNSTGGMTLDSYFKDTVNRLGIQEQEARRMITNQAKLLAGFQESRDSISGVSLDEEMANLVQFQHCYQANAKIISTIDQLLDVVVNGLRR